MEGPYIVIINTLYDVQVVNIGSKFLNNKMLFNKKNYNVIDDEIGFEIVKTHMGFKLVPFYNCFINSEFIEKDESVILNHGTVVTFKVNRNIINFVYMKKLVYSNKKFFLDYDCIMQLKNSELILYNGKKVDQFRIKSHDVLIIEDNLFICTKNHIITLSSQCTIDEQRFNLENNPVLQNPLILQNVSLDNRIENISLIIKPGELVALIGGSGVGKTTLIDLISGKLKQTSGKISLSKTEKINFGKVFQKDHLSENLTVNQLLLNKYAMLYCPKLNMDEKQSRVDDTIKMLKLEGVKYRKIKKLSGGEKKRVAIAIALLGYSKILFLDEPDSALSPELVAELMDNLKQICKDNKIIIIIVTHKCENVPKYYDKVIVLAKQRDTISNKQMPAQLAFFGTPNACLSFFSVDSMDKIYSKLGNNKDVRYYVSRFKEGNIK